MAFNYTHDPGCQLNTAIENLLEEVDVFQYDRLKPFTCLGDIHANLNVHVVNRIPDKVINVEMTLGQLKRMLEKTRKRNEEIEKTRKEEMDRMKESGDWSMERYLPHTISTRQIEEILNQNAGQPDSTKVKFPLIIHRSGYYTRDNNNKGLIVLEKRSSSEIASTYVHELMHAYYDDQCSGSMNDVEYVEEPLAEFGMLMFMEQFYSSDPSCADLFIKSYLGVKQKQNCIGIMHYGFGAELYDTFHDNDWEVMMNQRHTIEEGSLGTYSLYYDDIKSKLDVSWPDDADVDKVANDIIILLQNNTVIQPTKQNSGYGWFPYIFLCTIMCRCYGNSQNIKVGERIIYDNASHEWKTVNSNVEIFCRFVRHIEMMRRHSPYLRRHALGRPALSPNQFSFRVSKVTQRNIEIDCFYQSGVNIEEFIIDNEMVSVNIPALCKHLYLRDRRMLKHIFCQGNSFFHYDSANNILIDKNNRLVIGFDNSTIPCTVTSIGSWAFYHCQSLKNITIPNSVTSIGDYAFYECQSLQSVTTTYSGRYPFTFSGDIRSL